MQSVLAGAWRRLFLFAQRSGQTRPGEWHKTGAGAKEGWGRATVTGYSTG